MAKTKPSPFPIPAKRRYSGANIPMRVIRRYARAIAEEFHPEKIILFGSYAYGTPHEDSDVDLLVVMPAADQLSQALRIRRRLAPPFPLHLLVRTPKEMKWRLEDGASFTTTIMSQGKVLFGKRGRIPRLEVGPRESSTMKKSTREWVKKAEQDYDAGKQLSRSKAPLHDVVCFHCQQCAEKYLKGLLEELMLPVPKTHDLKALLTALEPHHPALRPMRRGAQFLTNFAVETRYPEENASKRQAAAALRWADRVRKIARALLGIVR